MELKLAIKRLGYFVLLFYDSVRLLFMSYLKLCSFHNDYFEAYLSIYS